MTSHPVILLAGLIALGALQTQRFTSRVEAVRADVLVMDGKRLVRGLTAGDFEVLDSGVPQRVQQIDVERLPLNLVCAFDTSGSVAGTRLRNPVDAGWSLVQCLQPQDLVALLSFASRVRLHATLTGNRGQILEALGALTAVGTTALRDAAFAGLAHREADEGRTLLLVFSDGADTSSWLPASRVLEAAKRTDVVVYAIAFRQRTLFRMEPLSRSSFASPDIAGNSGTTRQPDVKPVTRVMLDSGKFLQGLADETGGRVLLVESDRDLRATF